MQRGHNKAAKRVFEAQVILMVRFVLAFRIIGYRDIAFKHPASRAHFASIVLGHAITFRSSYSAVTSEAWRAVSQAVVHHIVKSMGFSETWTVHRQERVVNHPNLVIFQVFFSMLRLSPNLATAVLYRRRYTFIDGCL